MSSWFSKLQAVGKALMLPVAVLPAAALLLRLGAPDVFDIPFITQAGGAVFNNLALIFAVGIAVGLAKDNNGAAGLAGVIGYLVLTEALKAIDKDLNMGVLAGVIVGIISGILYNKFYNIKLPEFLGFFSGRRFGPIGEWIVGAGAAGAFVYGVLNRLLIPVGLHHILNSLVWFVFGSYTNPETGVTATGDLNRFFAGDATAGVFMAGFYFIFMFGVPAIALAMYSAAKPENKSKVAGMMFSIAFTAFLTGITEPVEFTFMFLAPVLYAFHAVMTGIALAVANMFGILHGFGFSAGLIDYVLNYGLATKAILIIPIGLVFGIIYFIVFRWAIVHFDLPTPGRFENESDNEAIENANPDELAQSFINKLGGADNLTTISSCITRLRLNVKDIDKIDEAGLKALGAAGVIKKGNSVQVIVGTKAEAVADDMKKIAKK